MPEPSAPASAPPAAALAAAAVATCWAAGQPAEAQLSTGQSATVTLDVATPVSDVYLLYGDASSGVLDYSDAIALPDAPAGQLATQVQLVDDFLSTEFQFAVIGVYSDPTAVEPEERSGISVTYSDRGPLILGLAFDEVFSESETDLLNALVADDTVTLRSFFENNFGSFGFGEFGFVGASLTGTELQVNFSRADEAGLATLTIPEPASLALLGCGAALMMRRRC
ncbi:PEP-CTERM sorting domain-containing protein [Phycisphaera mikurensis]|uniref:PEP-CTERM protein-sorting domain-containing protein n=1 Tax=Phycisphaera mikurensis (strain NBRC 102666 / KCTC 22515 / FYK2301M01) TaxID=1142394 RepID=I0IHB0_PHYMF|nr:PEP-CTERM sorting domain-containing protein [Phycisphaera mikurensis]MBB6440897.1 hypothetical protein [Phycisphaera mikurensis]BAM04648.1 hypothetical protein PSMK_24890 [Phycisphaera mikurensis NBRC 102666]